MILEEAKIKELALLPTDPLIIKMRQDIEPVRMHYFGDEDLTHKFLEKIEDFENSRQFELRKKLTITNEWLVDDLLKPADNVFSARGGSRSFQINDNQKEDFLKKLANVADGMGIRKYMQNVHNERFIVDPNGVTFVENDSEKCWLTYKDITRIKNYKTKGYLLDYIVFEPEKSKDNSLSITQGKKELWIVDDAKHYKVEIDGKNATIIEEIPHLFEIVPACLNSGIINTRKNYRDSVITKQVKLLNSYLTKNSRKEVFQMLHDFPLMWEYESTCPTCNGAKKVKGSNDPCARCGGTGYAPKADVSTIRVIKAPKDGQPAIPNPPFGYLQVDTESIEGQRVELDWVFEKAFFSKWGATRERAENETATGRFIDVQPVHNSLISWSDNEQQVEQILTNLIGKYYNPETYQPTAVIYGKRYLIETPDQIWNKYLEAKKDNAPDSSKSLLLTQYYETEFQNDPKRFLYYITLMKVEPFVHDTKSDVLSWENVKPEDKDAKVYYQEWVETLSMNDVVMMSNDVEKLRGLLKEYVNKNKNV